MPAPSHPDPGLPAGSGPPIRRRPPDPYGGATAETGLSVRMLAHYIDRCPHGRVQVAQRGAEVLAHEVCGMAAGGLRWTYGGDIDHDPYGIDGPPGLIWCAAPIDPEDAYRYLLLLLADGVARLVDAYVPFGSCAGPKGMYTRSVALHAEGIDADARVALNGDRWLA